MQKMIFIQDPFWLFFQPLSPAKWGLGYILVVRIYLIDFYWPSLPRKAGTLVPFMRPVAAARTTTPTQGRCAF